MLYGYHPAVITGFLLTAVPNWIGRMPLQGGPLLVLVLVWAVGRIAVTTSAWIGWEAAAVIDNAFLLMVAAAMGREIIRGRNWRNLKVLIALGVLLAGNILFHIEAHVLGAADYGIRFGIAATMMPIMLIGGRIIPSFTRNWLARENPGRLPAPFGRFDMVTTAAAGVALLAWIVAPDWSATGTALILHVAYAFVPLGFVLTGLAALGLVSTAAGIHAWSGGAMGVMTLAVMSSSSLGHTGRALVASAAMQGPYLLLVAGALARGCAAVHAEWSSALLHVAGLSWTGAFVGFALPYWNVFTRPRVTS